MMRKIREREKKKLPVPRGGKKGFAAEKKKRKSKKKKKISNSLRLLLKQLQKKDCLKDNRGGESNY